MKCTVYLVSLDGPNVATIRKKKVGNLISEQHNLVKVPPLPMTMRKKGKEYRQLLEYRKYKKLIAPPHTHTGINSSLLMPWFLSWKSHFRLLTARAVHQLSLLQQ